MTESSEKEIFLRSRADKTYASPAFPDFKGRKLRIANKVIEGGAGYEYAKIGDEMVLRQTEGGASKSRLLSLKTIDPFEA